MLKYYQQARASQEANMTSRAREGRHPSRVDVMFDEGALHENVKEPPKNQGRNDRQASYQVTPQRMGCIFTWDNPPYEGYKQHNTAHLNPINFGETERWCDKPSP